jgi:cell wall-associated NlpC family hydrolase
MPRDTKDQITMGERVDRDCIKTGDLLFFRRHVGLAIGRTHLVHASRGGGGVRINALVPGLPDYREDLDRDFVQARRMIT